MGGPVAAVSGTRTAVLAGISGVPVYGRASNLARQPRAVRWGFPSRLPRTLGRTACEVAAHALQHGGQNADFVGAEAGEELAGHAAEDRSEPWRECLPVLGQCDEDRAAVARVRQLRPKFERPLHHDPPGPGGFGVNRLTLREILLAGLDVCFGETFTGYSPAPDGRVTAHFTDGTSAAGDLLVGADGTCSAVRRQLLPDAVIDELGWAIYGRTPFASWVPDVLVDTFNRITGPGDVGMSVATCRALEPVASATARLAPSARLTGIPGYFSWTLPLTGPRLLQADAVSLHRAAAGLVEGWHPAVRRIIAEADVPATFPVRITSAQPVTPWPGAERVPAR